MLDIGRYCPWLARWLSNATVCQTVRLLSAVGVAGFVAWLTNLQEPGWALITSVIGTLKSTTDSISKGRNLIQIGRSSYQERK